MFAYGCILKELNTPDIFSTIAFTRETTCDFSLLSCTYTSLEKGSALKERICCPGLL